VGLRIVYSKISRQGFKGNYNYIKKDSIHYARIEVKLISFAIQKLKLDPLLGRKFEKLDDELTRELIFKNYRIVYDIMPNKQIIILSIHHHSRLISNNPAFRDED
jgi:toxin ParE1/3/4